MSGTEPRSAVLWPNRCRLAFGQRTRATVWAVAWMAALALLSSCRGGGARRRTIRAFQPTHIDGYLEYVTQRRDREQKSKIGTADTNSKERRTEENLNLEMTGFVYHPNFLEFALGGLFGLVQQDYEDNYAGENRRSSDNGPVVEFKFEGSFFKKKKYPGTVFARRYRAVEPRAFQPSLEVTTTTYGLNWQYIDEKTPTSFEFSHTDLDLDPNSDFETAGSKKNTLARFETAYKFNEYHILSLQYRYESVQEQPFNLDYKTNEVTVTDTLDFGAQKQHRLESEVNYFDQRGTFATERTRWRELLRMKHTKSLQSWYQFEFLDRTQGNLAGVPPIEERSYSLRGTLEHKLYKSLVTQVFLFGQSQRFGSGLNIDRYGAEIDLDYRKKNRWGVLLGGYRFRAEREDRSGGDQQVEVLDEAATFRDPEPVVLRNRNIRVSTIVVTAEDRITIFQPGRDYTIRSIGDQVEVRRVPTGRILDGQSVQIDYTFDIAGSFTLDTLNHQLRIRQNFQFGLSPYYRFRWQDQSISPVDASGARAEDITAHVIGAEFRRGSLFLQAEYEDYDSTISPFRAIRLSGSYTRRFASGASGALKARWTDITQPFPIDRETKFFTVEGRYRHPVSRRFLVEGSVVYRNEDDTLNGRDKGIDVDLSLEWTIRETDIKVTYEQVRFQDVFADNRSSVLYVQVRRRF